MSKSARRGSKSPPRTAFDDACRSLARRRLTEAELRKRLSKRHSDSEIEEALKKLREYHFVDDEALIADYTRDRLRLSPRSAELIETELYRRGIEPEDFRRVFEGEFPDYDEMEVARRALQTKLKTLMKSSQQGRSQEESSRLRERALRFLHSRGFSYEVMKEVWERFGNITDLSDEDNSNTNNAL